MSNVNDLLNDIDGDKAYYDPSQSTTKSKKQLVEGTYEAIVKKLSVKKDITIKGEFLADIFEATYSIDDDSNREFNGMEVKSKGYFRFKVPDKEKYPNLKDNSGQNKGYMIFCEACGFEMEKNEDGKFQLPFLMESDIAESRVVIKVELEEWTGRDGDKRTSPVAVQVFKSNKKDLSKDELPF